MHKYGLTNPFNILPYCYLSFIYPQREIGGRSFLKSISSMVSQHKLLAWLSAPHLQPQLSPVLSPKQQWSFSAHCQSQRIGAEQMLTLIQFLNIYSSSRVGYMQVEALLDIFAASALYKLRVCHHHLNTP